MRRTTTRLGLLSAFALVAMGCTGVLGDFSTAQVDDDGGATVDSGTDTNPTPPPPPPPPDDGGTDSGDIDTGIFDAGVDTAIPLGPPGKPGQSLTGGGIAAKSTNYKVWVAVGETPGGNVAAKSTNYKLVTGIIGATQ
jgi:hypothetical protein